MKEIREYLTPHKRFLLAGTAITGTVLANFSGPILVKFLPFNITLAIMQSVLSVVGHIFIASSVAIALCISIVLARSRGFTAKRIAVIALYYVLSLVMVIIMYIAHDMYRNFVEFITQLQADYRKEITEKLASATTIEKKAKLSQLNAVMVYENEGKIITYLNVDGTANKYRPTPEAEKNRNFVLFAQTFFKLQSKTLAANTLIWFLATLSAAFVGTRRKKVEWTEQQ